MLRRDFIKSGLISLSSISALDSSSFSQPLAQGSYSEGQKLTLSNRCLDWNLVMTGGTIKSLGLRNKLSDRTYELKDSVEYSLAFSQAKARVEIPWWRIHMGPDNDKSSSDQEEGYHRGYHLEDFRGEDEWGTTLNLLLRDARRVDSPPIFNGYAWLRQWFELAGDAEGNPIVFCL